MSQATCQYCGGQLAAPTHKACQPCNAIIAQANCDGVLDRVIASADAMRDRPDLDTPARRDAIQSAYQVAVGK